MYIWTTWFPVYSKSLQIYHVSMLVFSGEKQQLPLTNFNISIFLQRSKKNNVDERNPAPPEMYKTLQIIG